ncbi:hypothetical protein SAMN05192534_11240 [Alteribacillus persepolensis]|uniref:Uncharacterized protein n=1 Tax=Alteribacillus persepolensis TaxID=568899 RepID=A0A1G8FHL8_9BACI|nr:hypothetical protein [Alteribacillus persepolensis]SDH81620.1 hypothetical protein SAMN05192534_11240 [Alteribacillus persepolensis]
MSKKLLYACLTGILATSVLAACGDVEEEPGMDDGGGIEEEPIE